MIMVMFKHGRNKREINPFVQYRMRVRNKPENPSLIVLHHSKDVDTIHKYIMIHADHENAKIDISPGKELSACVLCFHVETVLLH